jgi:hypothetical protein
MTPKEKAIVLCFTMHKIEPLTGHNNITFYEAKQAALIAVDELIKYAKTFGDVTELDIQHFEDIKKEIELL